MSFQHKKSLGQHFLNSDYAPKKMCDSANIKNGEIVLEIGPGTGILTKELLRRGALVIAVEADKRAIEFLEDYFADAIACQQLKIYHHDARILDPTIFQLVDQQYKVVANIPYYLSGSLFRQLLDTTTQPNTLVFLVQKEVAERIARDKKESLLSLSIKVFGEPSYICTVKRSHFSPPPRVDSAIIAINNISRQNFNQISLVDFFNILHLGFGQKRKQLLGNLSVGFQRNHLQQIFTEIKLSETVRAEDIPLSTWLQLLKKLFPQNTHSL